MELRAPWPEKKVIRHEVLIREMRCVNGRGMFLFKMLIATSVFFTVNEAGDDFGESSSASDPERDPLLSDIDSKIQTLRIHKMQLKKQLNTSDALGGFR